jgi:hypothetical protein
MTDKNKLLLLLGIGQNESVFTNKNILKKTEHWKLNKLQHNISQNRQHPRTL